MRTVLFAITLIVVGIAGASALENFLSSQPAYDTDMTKMSQSADAQSIVETGDAPINLAAKAQ